MSRLAVLRRFVPRPGFPWSAPEVPKGLQRPAAPRRTGTHYDSAWARRPLARHARLLLLEGPIRLGVRALADPERAGLDRLEGLEGVEGALIFAANHHSHIDAPLLLTSIPEPWRHRIVVAAAADYFFTNRVTSAASALALNAIPIERTRVTRRSADQAAELLSAGWSMLIFPEGGRSPDGWGQPFRAGAAYLAIRSGVPVVPVHLLGTGRVLPKGSKLVRPARTTITFGSPQWPTKGEDTRRFGSRLEREVAALADEASTDWYSARRRSHAGGNPSLAGPEVGAWRRLWALGERRRIGGPRRRQAWPDLD